MTPNRRILPNIVATYGRSLYALVCGLFISRWVLATVGKSEERLYGVVGGMTVIVMLAYTMRLVRGRIAAVGWENGRLDNFLHGVGILCVTHLCC